MYKNKYKSLYCGSSLTINVFFQYLPVFTFFFTTALLLPFHSLIKLIPMQYWKQLHLHLRAIAYTTTDTLPKQLLQYYYRRSHKLAVIKQMPPHINLQSSTGTPIFFSQQLHMKEDQIGWTWYLHNFTFAQGLEGGGPDLAFPPLFQENPASCTFFVSFPNPTLLFQKNTLKV